MRGCGVSPGPSSAVSSALVLVFRAVSFPAPSNPSFLSSFWLSMPPSVSVPLDPSHSSKSTGSCTSWQHLRHACESFESCMAAGVLQHAQLLLSLSLPGLQLWALSGCGLVTGNHDLCHAALKPLGELRLDSYIDDFVAQCVSGASVAFLIA